MTACSTYSYRVRAYRSGAAGQLYTSYSNVAQASTNSFCKLSIFYVSPAGSGTVGGVSYAPTDILKFDSTTGIWSMYFDASDVKVTTNLVAFAFMPDGSILMSFAANQPVAGLGTFAPHDVARFVPTKIGNTTAGSFQWYIDGSDVGLSTTAETIDALGYLVTSTGSRRVRISTKGSASVPFGTTQLKAQNEDVLVFTVTTTGLNTSGTWRSHLDATPIAGMSGENLNGYSYDPSSNDLYITIQGAFNLGGVAGNSRSVVKLTASSATPPVYTPSILRTLPIAVDALEVGR